MIFTSLPPVHPSFLPTSHLLSSLFFSSLHGAASLSLLSLSLPPSLSALKFVGSVCSVAAAAIQQLQLRNEKQKMIFSHSLSFCDEKKVMPKNSLVFFFCFIALPCFFLDTASSWSTGFVQTRWRSCCLGSYREKGEYHEFGLKNDDYPTSLRRSY